MIAFPSKISKIIIEKLEILYGQPAKHIIIELENLLNNYREILALQSDNNYDHENSRQKLSKNNIILNCYADSILEKQSDPLEALHRFSTDWLQPIINGIHILPFYKWDTDRGFSVLDYYSVDPRNGTWGHFSKLHEIFDILMVDCVLNHASIDNNIIQQALIGHPEYQNFVISFSIDARPSETDLLKITRARPSPVLTQYFVLKNDQTYTATFDKPPDLDQIVTKGWVWTTFSRPDHEDGKIATRQVDLNYANPKMLLEIINVMLFYVSKSASWIRLDAVGYLWKKLGTNCLHQPETHTFIELLAIIFHTIKTKDIILISEVNEPQEQAFQYLESNSLQSSDMIYLFTHFPLAVHAVLTGSATFYANWLPSLAEAKSRLFVSVLGTHDGMGMKPIGTWLPEAEKKKLQQILVNEYGALPNYAKLPGGEKIIYELCSTTWNFINKENSTDSVNTQINRYIVVFALGLMLRGVPSIYINGLLGISNNKAVLDENRSINRQQLELSNLNLELSNPDSRMSQILERMKQLITIRQNELAFDLKGNFEVQMLNDKVVSVLLYALTNNEGIFALVNVSNSNQIVEIDKSILNIQNPKLIDLVSERMYIRKKDSNIFDINLFPYQVCWLKFHA